VNRELGDRVRTRDNAFDVVRLLGALLVLVSHSFALVGSSEPHLGISAFGTIGVEIFFAVSGFLVVASWLSEPRIRAFIVKRALRILPALVVTVLLSAFVLGPLVSSVSPLTYFESSLPFRYVLGTVGATVSASTVLNMAYHLPGVFAGNPSDAVNGSLWTLPIEVRAYVLVVLLGVTSVLVDWLWLPVLAGLAYVAATGSETGSLLTLFFVASLLYRHRDRVPLHRGLALAALALWMIGVFVPHAGVAICVAIPYLVIYLAFRAPRSVRSLARPGDVSYGLYLLAFPVQQVAVHLIPGLTGLGLVAISLPVTYVLALVSWRLVERPALGMKAALTRAGVRPLLGRRVKVAVPTVSASDRPGPSQSLGRP
jgi:peptidoglycan/LPS O-acetylase OafA/YrhL